MWEPLRDAAERRSASPRHESRWFNLAGYCLRPGTGFPLDEARIKALWPAFHQGVKHAKDVQCWAEWWILWRRVAAGLIAPHHEEIHRRLLPFLLPPKGGTGGKKPARPKPEAHELAEMWRCAASLERLAAVAQGAARRRPVASWRGRTRRAMPLWCLGRLGARVPLYGPANTVVHPEKASRWVGSLLGRTFAPGRETADAVFALAQLARVSGDRARDLDEALEAPGPRPPRSARGRRGRRSARSASTTSWRAAQQGAALGRQPAGRAAAGRTTDSNPYDRTQPRPRQRQALWRRASTRPDDPAYHFAGRVRRAPTLFAAALRRR